MAQMDGPQRIRQKASANVYSVLTFVAFAALLTGVIFMWITNLELTAEQQNPQKQFKNPWLLVDNGQPQAPGGGN